MPTAPAASTRLPLLLAKWRNGRTPQPGIIGRKAQKPPSDAARFEQLDDLARGADTCTGATTIVGYGFN